MFFMQTGLYVGARIKHAAQCILGRVTHGTKDSTM
jgi:hypothetical protein